MPDVIHAVEEPYARQAVFEHLLRSTVLLLRRLALIGRHTTALDRLAHRAWELVAELKSLRDGAAHDPRVLSVLGDSAETLATRIEAVLSRDSGWSSAAELVDLATELEDRAFQVADGAPAWALR